MVCSHLKDILSHFVSLQVYASTCLAKYVYTDVNKKERHCLPNLIILFLLNYMYLFGTLESLILSQLIDSITNEYQSLNMMF